MGWGVGWQVQAQAQAQAAAVTLPLEPTQSHTHARRAHPLCPPMPTPRFMAVEPLNLDGTPQRAPRRGVRPLERRRVPPAALPAPRVAAALRRARRRHHLDVSSGGAPGCCSAVPAGTPAAPHRHAADAPAPPAAPQARRAALPRVPAPLCAGGATPGPRGARLLPRWQRSCPDRATTVRQHLESSLGQGILEEQPPPSLIGRYSG